MSGPALGVMGMVEQAISETSAPNWSLGTPQYCIEEWAQRAMAAYVRLRGPNVYRADAFTMVKRTNFTGRDYWDTRLDRPHVLQEKAAQIQEDNEARALICEHAKQFHPSR